ncbi:MAG: hypothetical protein PVH95_04175 [Anaerolineae bacterium]
MSETKRLFRVWGVMTAVIPILIVAVLALTGCSGPGEIAVVEPTATIYAPPPTDIPAPPPGPTPAALDFPIAAPTRAEAEPEEEASDATCVDCHTSEQVLRAMATEEEAPEVESEGEG